MANNSISETGILRDARSRHQADALGVSEGDALLSITHVGSTADGTVVEVTRHVVGPGWTLRYGIPLS
jgi:GntR family transcriptional regulator